ncbi:hypothetical protein AMAG_01280 [Allomyces macrogynus ATCC 38327]|uniref:Uncharacterized protein n=1 Tax=Allomyces macrogynus (strain ATCC 38327) TaxID=578462 RepID=A0A0L0RYF1_ALLM3|nr:hypothetical protein AMAG_01280 [Allomyces macrogynus ATCC 38327]|eukprot:KNE55383.1 hypothetical protein AMAG_01280 [Allomyces macrogynus ATCC 38327]
MVARVTAPRAKVPASWLWRPTSSSASSRRARAVMPMAAIVVFAAAASLVECPPPVFAAGINPLAGVLPSANDDSNNKDTNSNNDQPTKPSPAPAPAPSSDSPSKPSPTSNTGSGSPSSGLATSKGSTSSAPTSDNGASSPASPTAGSGPTTIVTRVQDGITTFITFGPAGGAPTPTDASVTGSAALPVHTTTATTTTFIPFTTVYKSKIVVDGTTSVVMVPTEVNNAQDATVIKSINGDGLFQSSTFFTVLGCLGGAVVLIAAAVFVIRRKHTNNRKARVFKGTDRFGNGGFQPGLPGSGPAPSYSRVAGYGKPAGGLHGAGEDYGAGVVTLVEVGTSSAPATVAHNAGSASPLPAKEPLLGGTQPPGPNAQQQMYGHAGLGQSTATFTAPPPQFEQHQGLLQGQAAAPMNPPAPTHAGNPVARGMGYGMAPGMGMGMGMGTGVPVSAPQSRPPPMDHVPAIPMHSGPHIPMHAHLDDDGDSIDDVLFAATVPRHDAPTTQPQPPQQQFQQPQQPQQPQLQQSQHFQQQPPQQFQPQAQQAPHPLYASAQIAGSTSSLHRPVPPSGVAYRTNPETQQRELYYLPTASGLSSSAPPSGVSVAAGAYAPPAFGAPAPVGYGVAQASVSGMAMDMQPMFGTPSSNPPGTTRRIALPQ